VVQVEISPEPNEPRRGLLRSFSEEELDLLQAIVDTVIPEDAWPGGWNGGVAALLQHPVGAMDELVEPLRAAVRRVDAAARNSRGTSFLELGPAQRLELVEAEYLADKAGAGTTREVEDSEYGADTTGTGAGPQTVAALVTVAFEGFYAGLREPAGWAMVGYRPLPEGIVPLDGEV
jgi:hypothetical protein